MSWRIGTGKFYDVAKQTDVTYPALVSDTKIMLLYIGPPKQGAYIFEYQDDLVKFDFFSTRDANFHGPLLANSEQQPTKTWTVNFAVFMIQPKKGVVLSTEILNRIKSNIESAFLSHPSWPSSFGRPDL